MAIAMGDLWMAYFGFGWFGLWAIWRFTTLKAGF